MQSCTLFERGVLKELTGSIVLFEKDPTKIISFPPPP